MNAILAYFRLRRMRRAERKRKKKSAALRDRIEDTVNVRVRDGRLFVVVKGYLRDIYIDPSLFMSNRVEDVVNRITEDNVKLEGQP